MARYQKTSMETRTRVVVLVEQGQSRREVGRQLGLNVKTVCAIVKKHQETGFVKDNKRSGRPKKTTKRQGRILIRTSLVDRRLTSPELRAKLDMDHGVSISASTVRSRLYAAGLRGCVAAKKPLLRTANVKTRLEFARTHKDWTVEQWDKVLWSDESCFQLFCGAKRAFVRRRVGERFNPECVVSTVKHLMVWGCMSGLGIGQLYRCEGTMKQDQYLKVLRNQMLPSVRMLYGEEQSCVFQHDNAPCHKSRKVTDLNPIEHLWEVLFRKVQNNKPSNLDALWQLLSVAWQDIQAETIQNLVHSMPKRCAAVIAAKGRHTKY